MMSFLLIIAIISSKKPKHNHITPKITFFTHKNHSKDTINHVIDKINKVVLLVFIIIASVKFKYI